MCLCNTWSQTKTCVTCWTISIASLAALLMLIIFPSITVNIKVGQSEAGVLSNPYTMELKGPYLQGAYNVKVGEKFLLFTRTIQDLTIGSISCLTKDKLLIELSVASQYQYNIEYIIPTLLKEFKDDENFKVMINNVARSIISNTCLKFTAEEYYTQRSIVDSAMSKNLIEGISNMTIGVDLEYFQLSNVQFPSSFSSVIQTKQNTQQTIITAQNQRISDQIAANTKLLQAERTAQITLINANATALTNINLAVVSSGLVINYWSELGIAYASIKESLGLNSTSFIGYLKSELFKNSKTPVVGLTF